MRQKPLDYYTNPQYWTMVEDQAYNLDATYNCSWYDIDENDQQSSGQSDFGHGDGTNEVTILDTPPPGTTRYPTGVTIENRGQVAMVVTVGFNAGAGLGPSTPWASMTLQPGWAMMWTNQGWYAAQLQDGD